MFTTTELFGKIHSSRRPQHLAQARGRLRQRPLHQLETLCEGKFPPGWAALHPTQANSRQRIYTPRITTLSFLAQVLSPASSCREAVRHVAAYYLLQPDGPRASADTSPYCQSRRRLELQRLLHIRQHLGEGLQANVPSGAYPWPHPVKVVDGTCFNLPDTPANQAAYPQSQDQQPGCGFPLVRMLGVFCLQSGALLERAYADYGTSEGALLRQLWPTFQAGDIVLADRLFDSYGNLAGLLQGQVHALFHLNAHRLQDFRRGQALGQHDRLCQLTRPARPAAGWTEQAWAALPPTLTVRKLKLRLRQSNGRVRKIVLITTLLDPLAWPKALLLLVYLYRWKVELCLDDIKTTLQMDLLSCKTPALAHKELEMHLIAYNLTRTLMQEAALTCHVPLSQMSFKGTLDTMRQFSQTMARVPKSHHHIRRQIYVEMLAAIAKDQVPDRPGRREPRCLKRRPKAYPFLTKPRHLMKDAPKSSRRQPKPSPQCSPS